MTLFETLSAALAANPILAGGIGTLAFGSLMYLLRMVPERLLDLIERTIWTKVFVESLSNEYRDVDSFIEGRRFRFFGRSLEIKDGHLKTGFGSGWGLYAGTLFRYSKSKSTQQIAPFETITLSFLTRDRSVIERFMKDSRPEEHKSSISVAMYTAGGTAGALRRRKRGLDTVFVDQAIKDRLVERFSWFERAEAWHMTRGIPWKLGIVLYGPPGTGKTSLIHAIASDFGYNIKYLKSLNGLGAAFLTSTRNDLFVIEDIDTIAGGLNRDAVRARAAASRVKELENRIARDINVAQLNMRTAKQRMELTRQMTEQSSQALDLAQTRYELGLSSVVELSQAQLGKLQAEIQNATATFDYQVQHSLVEFHVGRLR